MAMTDEPGNELLNRFRALAITHAVASEKGDSETANRAVEMTAQLIREMWSRGDRKKDALKSLTGLAASDDPRIALKAIVYTVELFPEVASQLKRLTRDKGLVGLGATYTLENIKNGKHRVLKEILGNDVAEPHAQG